MQDARDAQKIVMRRSAPNFCPYFGKVSEFTTNVQHWGAYSACPLRTSQTIRRINSALNERPAHAWRVTTCYAYRQRTAREWQRSRDADKTIQGNHAIAKMTARCAQYVSALKIVGLGKRKISRRLRKHLHITIRRWKYYRSIPSNVITAPNYLNVSDGQTDRRTLLWHHLATRSIAR